MAAKTRTLRGSARRTAAAALTAIDRGAELDRGAALQESFAVALQRAFEMAPEDALVVAGIVAERFEGRREVNDEHIDAEVRSLFYTLESRRLLSFRREEYDTAEGQRRRAFWWRVRDEVLTELCAPPRGAGEDDVYASLPAECWRREADKAGA